MDSAETTRGSKEPSSTQRRILDAAEELFALGGVGATSLRSIVARAGVNLAAIHYHFGSKLALTQAVFARRLTPLNAERLQLLERYEAEAQPHSPTVEDILRALILPALRVARECKQEGKNFVRLMGRIYSEQSDELAELLRTQLGDIVRRFTSAFSRALPHLPPAGIVWRLHFSVGALIHAISDPVRIRKFTEGLCDPDDFEGVADQLITFLSAAWRAPGAGSP